MKVEILFLDGCPNYLPALERVRTILTQQGLRAELSQIRIHGEAEATALCFPGSPTIRVNGLDIEPASRVSQQTGLACRRYEGGLPSEEMIRAALREAVDN